MDLKDINVIQILSDWTKDYIYHADYDTLRHACLERKPIDPVISEIQSYLHKEFKSTFQKQKNQRTKDFFSHQEKEDINEHNQDEREHEKDQRLKETLSNRLLKLKYEIIDHKLVDTTISKEKNEYNTKKSTYEKKLAEQKEKLKNLEEASKLKVEVYPSSYRHTNPSVIKADLYSSSSLHVNSGDINVQVYPNGPAPSSQERLSHSNQPYLTQVYPQQPHVPFPSPPDPITEAKRKKYKLKIEEFNEELSKLKGKISGLDMEQLANAFSIAELNKEINNINVQLDVDIPNREQRRSERAAKRKDRQTIRNTSSQDWRQLSYDNERALKHAIDNAEQVLLSQLNGKINEAKKASYFLFLKLLPHNLNLQLPNRKLLVNLSQSMRQYEELQANIEELTIDLNNKIQTLQANEETLIHFQKQHSQFKKTNQNLKQSSDDLQTQNDRLKTEIINLNQKIKHYSGRSVVMLFATTLVTLSVGILLHFNIIPAGLIYLSIGLCAASATGLAYFACPYLYGSHKKATAEDQISKNERQISTNEKQIKQNEDEALSLENKQIPKIKLHLDEIPKIIQNIKQEISDSEQNARNLLDCAMADSDPRASQPVNFNLSSSFFSGGNNKVRHRKGSFSDAHAPSHVNFDYPFNERDVPNDDEPSNEPSNGGDYYAPPNNGRR